MSNSERERTSSQSHSWIYTVSKVQLIDSLAKFSTRDLLQLFSIVELRKIAVKWYKNIDSNVGVKSSESNTDGNLEIKLHSTIEDKEESMDEAVSESGFSDRESTTSMDMERESWIFNPKKEDWESYIERLELYFEIKNVSPEKKTAHLLTNVGMEVYKLIRELCAPEKPKDKEFQDIVELVKNHLSPKRNEAMERCKFHQAKQAPNESIANYIARLKELALFCNFADLNIALRDQLVCGIADHDTRVALFSESKLTYDKAVQMASTRETALKNAKSTEEAGTSKETAVEKISSKHRPLNNNNRDVNSRDFNNTKSNYSYDKSYLVPNVDNKYICFCCGKVNDHYVRNCRLKGITCNWCKGRGHIERMCFRRKGKREVINDIIKKNGKYKAADRNNMLYVQNETDESDSSEQFESDFCSIFVEMSSQDKRICNIKADPQFVMVNIKDKVVKMEIDTGAYVAAMSEENKNLLFPDAQLSRCDLILTSYNSVQLNPIGILKNIEVKFRNEVKYLDLYIIKSKGPTLLGRQWLKAFGLWPITLTKTNDSDDLGVLHIKEDIKSKFLKQFPELFSDTQGCYTGRKIKLFFKDNVKPVQMKPYHTPFALTNKISEEIKRLVKAGSLVPVACSEWATPVIPVLKKNGQVRLCGNFKITVNPQLIIKRHPIPIKEKIFKTMQIGSSWSQIDLRHAFMQFLVDEGSRDALTIITEMGLFSYTKLPEGIASSPAECQEILEDILKDVPYTEVYIDNVYCTGRNDNEHIEILCEIFRRLEKAGLRINLDKCDFFKKEIEILGFLLDKTGLKPTPSKIQAINEMPVPSNFKELKAFLGLLNFYERFLPDRAERVRALYDLCKKTKWEWTDECMKSFLWLKKQITSDRVLTLYDPHKQLVLACDASYHGLSAVLSHRYSDGSERPIAFASKIIPKNELHRTILDKEAAAIVFGFRKFYQYVYGARIVLKTDHEALKYIFGSNKHLSIMIQSRLIRWAYFLHGFTYDIEVVKSQANGNCDALSRFPSMDNTPVFESEFSCLNYVAEGVQTLDFKCVAHESMKDQDLKNVIKYLQQGWPKDTKKLNSTEKSLFNKRLELTVEKGCLLWGYRVVIPKTLQQDMLHELHASHMGAVKMKQLARNYFWWPNLNEDIDQIIGTCKNCLESRAETPKVTLTPWQWPSEPWTRIHTDFLGPFHGHMFLVVLDAHSKWPEIVDMKNNTQAEKLIKVFKKIFSRHGFPDLLVSDNGRQYTSYEFANFLKERRIHHAFSPPYCPATNGAAENFVKTFKSNVNKIIKDGYTLEDAVNMFLFDYRSTVHCTTGRTPAWLLYKREIRTRFDLIKPNVKYEVERNQFNQKTTVNGKRKCDLELGEKVFVKDHRSNAKIRSEAEIIKKNSPSTYNVRFNDGTICKKHANQIIKTKLNKNSTRTEGSELITEQHEAHEISPHSTELPRRSSRLKQKTKKEIFTVNTAAGLTLL